MMAERALLLLALAVICCSATWGPTTNHQAAATAVDDDDSVRCRMSGICEGAAARAHCASRPTLPAAPPTADSGALAAARDAELACTLAPAARAAKVRDAAAWAWKGYRDCALGQDELLPLSCGGQHWVNLSLTAVDSMDTLHILGLTEEFDQAAELVATSFAPHAAGDCNVFETTIRALGGLLSAAHLAAQSHPGHARRLLELAADLGARLAAAFDSPSGVPHSDVDLSSGATSGSVPLSSTSELGTLSLEFTLLARLAGAPALEAAALRVHDSLGGALAQWGALLPQYVDVGDGAAQGGHIMLGARTDSYYEYLLKQWIMTGKTDERLRQRYVEAMQAVRERLLRRTAGAPDSAAASCPALSDASAAGAGSFEFGSLLEETAVDDEHLKHGGNELVGPAVCSSEPSGGDDSGGGEGRGLLYVGEETTGSLKRLSPKMDHLVCFLPGLLALGDLHGVSTARPATPDAPDLAVARELAHTCHQLYRRTPTGLAPEIAHFNTAEEHPDFPGSHAADIGGGDFSVKDADAHNLLRPETVESFFILWKVTGDPLYREQAWAVFRAFERWTRVEGMEQCLGADPVAASEEVSRAAADAAAGAAAAALGAGQSLWRAQRAGAQAADAAIAAALVNATAVDGQYVKALKGMSKAAANAAVTATIHVLGAGCKTGKAAAAVDDSSATNDAAADGGGDKARGCLPTSGGGGYTALESVTVVPPPRRDKMESFWLAETLKYLFLIFTEPPDRCLHPSCQEAAAQAEAALGQAEAALEQAEAAVEEGAAAQGEAEAALEQVAEATLEQAEADVEAAHLEAEAPLEQADAAQGHGQVQAARFPLDRFVFNTEAHPFPVVGPAGASLVAPAGLSPLLLRPYEGGGAFAAAAGEVQEEEERARQQAEEVEVEMADDEEEAEPAVEMTDDDDGMAPAVDWTDGAEAGNEAPSEHFSVEVDGAEQQATHDEF